MPQLVKGGKWVFGWCVVGPAGETQIPPEAYLEYGFQSGEKLVVIHGIQPGERLLAVRGSNMALGFVQRGPIFEGAQKHPEIETFQSTGKR
jgi:hypothetical protein